jgi:acyl-CoA synthetase (AMP-forming)/AMP-acid ligase II
MTEDWGISHMGRVGNLKPGWIGPPVPGVEQRLTSEGEILVRTPGMMLGYYKAPELTREVIDDERWLHTGDRGVIDAEGRLRITGRVKELFKTSKKYVARTDRELPPRAPRYRAGLRLGRHDAALRDRGLEGGQRTSPLSVDRSLRCYVNRSTRRSILMNGSRQSSLPATVTGERIHRR